MIFVQVFCGHLPVDNVDNPVNNLFIYHFSTSFIHIAKFDKILQKTRQWNYVHGIFVLGNQTKKPFKTNF